MCSEFHHVQAFIHIIFCLRAMRKMWLTLFFWWRNRSSGRVNYSPKFMVWDSGRAFRSTPSLAGSSLLWLLLWAYATVVHPCLKEVKMNRAFVLDSMHPICISELPVLWMTPQPCTMLLWPPDVLGIAFTSNKALSFLYFSSQNTNKNGKENVWTEV